MIDIFKYITHKACFGKINLFSLEVVIIICIFSGSIYLFSQNGNPEKEYINDKEDFQDIMNFNILDSNSECIFKDAGIASYYGKKFNNRKTANGEIFNMNEYSAAHRTLPFGTVLKVTNNDNNKSVIVRINDRGPFINSRIIDLSYEAAKEIDGAGLPNVSLEGFVPKTNIQENPNLNNYFLGYSLNHPLVCINKSILTFIVSTKSFNEAMTLYKTYLESHSNVISYLMIPANQIFHNDNNNNDKFYIALIHPLIAQRIKDFANILNKKIESK